MIWVARELFDVRGPLVGKRGSDGKPIPLPDQLLQDGTLTQEQLDAVFARMSEILEGADEATAGSRGPAPSPPPPPAKRPRSWTEILTGQGVASPAASDGADWLGKLASSDTHAVVHPRGAHGPAASSALPERIETLADAEALCARLTEVPENPEDAAWLVDLIVNCKNPLAREKLQAHIMALHRKAKG